MFDVVPVTMDTDVNYRDVVSTFMELAWESGRLVGAFQKAFPEDAALS